MTLESVPWGDSGATSRVTLADGRVVAVRRFDGPDARVRAERSQRRFEWLAGAGILVPSPAEIDDTGSLMTPWVDGTVGARALDDPAGSRALADSMGRLARRIATIDHSSLDPHLDLDAKWGGPKAFAANAAGWLATLDGSIERSERGVAARDVESVCDAWDAGPAWSNGVAHGDLAPINVIVRKDGSLVLLDLDDLCLAPRVFDVAWWGWVVRYHHSDAWSRTWSALLDAAGIERSARVEAAATSVGRLRCLQRAAEAPDAAARATWLERHRETAAW